MYHVRVVRVYSIFFHEMVVIVVIVMVMAKVFSTIKRVQNVRPSFDFSVSRLLSLLHHL